MTKPLLAAIEAGGTKFNLAVGYGSDETLRQTRINTEHPQQTLEKCARFFKQAQQDFGSIDALGIGSFGPISLNNESTHYGAILNTPKPDWSNVNLVDFFSNELACPISLDSDVNAAALAEHSARSDSGNLIYITVGTGVGVGVCIEGSTLKGQLHCELGHLAAELLPGESPGVCYAHKNCVEGLICGPALKLRWGEELETTSSEHPLWQSTAHYLAQLCSAITLAYSPYTIVVGGGVASSGYLLGPLREVFSEIMTGYLPEESFPQGLHQFIDTPYYKDKAGLVGAYMLASKKIS